MELRSRCLTLDPVVIGPVADRMPWGKGRRPVGYGVAQGVFTPADITLTIPDPTISPIPSSAAAALDHTPADR